MRAALFFLLCVVVARACPVCDSVPEKIDIRAVPISPNVPRLSQPSTVRPEHEGTDNPLGVSAAEWQARTELAAGYRSLYLHGLERSTLGSDQAAQCLMMRHPENKHQFLMSQWGIWFEEVTASNLLKYDFDSNLVDVATGELSPADSVLSNMGCIPVATAIFKIRPDVNVISHIHPYAVMAVGGMKDGLLPLSQAAFFLYGQVSREEYDFSYENSFEDTLSAGFVNGERAMLLNHHGMYAVGRTVAESVFVAFHLTQACEVQVRTLSMAGGDLDKVILPPGDMLDVVYRDMMTSPDYAYDGSREWAGIVRKLNREAPLYNM